MSIVDPRVGATIAAYDQVAAAYAARWAGPETAEVAWLRRFAADLAPGGLVVDLGCGPGRDLRLCQQLGIRAVGLDHSAGMLREAQSRGRRVLVQGEFAHLPFGTAVADGLWLCASFLHVPKRSAVAVLIECRRVLRPGGRLAFNVKQGDGEGWTNRRQRASFFAWWQPAELDAVLVAAGFRVLAAATQPDRLGREPWLWRLATHDHQQPTTAQPIGLRGGVPPGSSHQPRSGLDPRDAGPRATEDDGAAPAGRVALEVRASCGRPTAPSRSGQRVSRWPGTTSPTPGLIRRGGMQRPS